MDGPTRAGATGATARQTDQWKIAAAGLPALRQLWRWDIGDLSAWRKAARAAESRPLPATNQETATLASRSPPTGPPPLGAKPRRSLRLRPRQALRQKGPRLVPGGPEDRWTQAPCRAWLATQDQCPLQIARWRQRQPAQTLFRDATPEQWGRGQQCEAERISWQLTRQSLSRRHAPLQCSTSAVSRRPQTASRPTPAGPRYAPVRQQLDPCACWRDTPAALHA